MKSPPPALVRFLRSRRRILVSGHVRSDGDALGSQLAFWHALRKMKKNSHVVCDGGALPEYRFLPGAERVGSGPADLRPPYDAVVTFDSGSWDRLERVARALPRESVAVVNVDHHVSNTRFGDYNWIDPSSSSSGEMAWRLIRTLGVRPDRNMATCVYVAVLTDTGKFCFSNTTAETHQTAAELLSYGVRPHAINHALFRQKTPAQLRFLGRLLERIRLSRDGRVGWVSIAPSLIRETGYEPGDTQEYIDLIKSIRGVDVAVLLRPIDGKVKVSFRTQEGIDGVALASKWGGGGHARASGASLPGRSLTGAEREVIRETMRHVRESR